MAQSRMSRPQTDIAVPWIEEELLGQLLALRASAVAGLGDGVLGPPDLVHMARHDSDSSESPGMFHCVNGIDYSRGEAAVEDYVLAVAGVIRHDGGYFLPQAGGKWSLWEKRERATNGAKGEKKTDGGDLFRAGARLVVVTLCTYNVFARAEVRVRFEMRVGARAKTGRPVAVHREYSVKTRQKVRTGALDAPAWGELAVATLVRCFCGVDDPARLVCGTVSLAAQVCSARALRAALERGVRLLPRGHLTGMRAGFGGVTALLKEQDKTVKSGGKSVKDGVKDGNVSHRATPSTSSIASDQPDRDSDQSDRTLRYRNRLVDTLVRLVQLDSSGRAAARAADLVRSIHGDAFSVVEARLLRAQHSASNDQRFLALAHSHVLASPWLAQSALLVVEQVRFLISRGALDPALALAARAVRMLPLDFDCWYHLALCHAVRGNLPDAVRTLAQLPVLFARTQQEGVDGFPDVVFLREQAAKNGVRPRFASFGAKFEKAEADPSARPYVQLGAVFPLPTWAPLAADLPAPLAPSAPAGPPVFGPYHLTPLLRASALELSVLDAAVAKVSAQNSPRLLLCAHSAGAPPCVLDWDRASTFGRAHSLVTFMAAVYGWDAVVRAKTQVFELADSKPASPDSAEFPASTSRIRTLSDSETRKEQHITALPTAATSESTLDVLASLEPLDAPAPCPLWLDLLFLVVYDDLRTVLTVSDVDRSALSWQMIGLLGWTCKINLKDSITALMTSVAAAEREGSFDYFGTIKLLEIYSELVLSSVDESSIDLFSCVYDQRHYAHKLALRRAPKIMLDLVSLFSLEYVLQLVLRYVAWTVRWYGYMPSFLVTDTLIRLCYKYDPVQIRATMRVVSAQKPEKKQLGSARLALDSGVVEYVDSLLDWIDMLSSSQNTKEEAESE